jgi:hypothetical protein
MWVEKRLVREEIGAIFERSEIKRLRIEHYCYGVDSNTATASIARL